MKKAVYAGSFDLLTNGHVWMIEEGARLFDTLIVAVGDNPTKKSMFSVEQRIQMIRECTKDLKNVQVEQFYGRYLVKYAQSVGAEFILRGIRGESDYESERGMRHINHDLNQNIGTIFLMPPRKLNEVSSSMVKAMVGPSGWHKYIRPYVPECVHKEILAHYAGKQFVAAWSTLVPTVGDLKASLSKESYGWDVFKHLVQRYLEPHRAYHNLTHILDCLDELAEFDYQYVDDLTGIPGLKAEEKNTLIVALWFHDAIYDPKAKDNEEQSAKLFFTFADNAGMNPSTVNLISDMILATKSHESKHPLTSILLDIDLSILGRDTEAFNEYDENIRKEYHFVPRAIYAPKRFAIMRSFLKRERLFITDYFHKKYDDQSRKNIGTITLTGKSKPKVETL